MKIIGVSTDGLLKLYRYDYHTTDSVIFRYNNGKLTRRNVIMIESEGYKEGLLDVEQYVQAIKVSDNLYYSFDEILRTNI